MQRTGLFLIVRFSMKFLGMQHIVEDFPRSRQRLAATPTSNQMPETTQDVGLRVMQCVKECLVVVWFVIVRNEPRQLDRKRRRVFDDLPFRHTRLVESKTS